MLSDHQLLLAALVEHGRVRAPDVKRAERHAVTRGIGVPEALVELGAATDRDLALARAVVGECAFVDLDAFVIDLGNAALVPRTMAEEFEAFPLFARDDHVTIGMADPLDLRGVDRLRGVVRREIEPVLCEPKALRVLIERAYSVMGSARAAPAPVPTAAGAGVEKEPFVAALDQILASAVEEGASDVHLQPDERELLVRFRVDGELRSRQAPPLSSHPGLVQRVKVMANLDLTQTRRPQDGKFRFQPGGVRSSAVEVRVSIVPTVTGENVVLRLLGAASGLETTASLGIPPAMDAEFREALAQSHGMIVVTGPTGSGKTTTLYAALRLVNDPGSNVMTIEDPVEIRLARVRHVEVHPEVGLTFAGALRAALRQDPDVILVGEIRDEETARTAVQAALTGHLVLSTLHTNDATGAVSRLLDLSCPPFAIIASLVASLSQRLVRRVCDGCAAPHAPDALLLRRLTGGGDASGFRKGRGCPRCMNLGYKGRIGVYELMRMRPEVQRALEEGAGPAALRRGALRAGMRPLWMDGIEKARLGQTTLEEVALAGAATVDADTAALAERASPAARVAA
ncbi:MAG: GspE/PulE family protein [Phycisphaerales bacterium]